MSLCALLITEERQRLALMGQSLSFFSDKFTGPEWNVLIWTYGLWSSGMWPSVFGLVPVDISEERDTFICTANPWRRVLFRQTKQPNTNTTICRDVTPCFFVGRY